MSAEQELEDAPVGTLLVAGLDTMVKNQSGSWYRQVDASSHDSADVADFHGHSGYSLAGPESGDSESKGC